MDLPERFSYRVKRRLLGQPLTNDRLKHERLSTVVALGVLAPDCISSSAYGTEEILVELLPYTALGAFALVLPITGVVIGILILLTLSYRQVVSVYTKAGGSRRGCLPAAAAAPARPSAGLFQRDHPADGGGDCFAPWLPGPR